MKKIFITICLLSMLFQPIAFAEPYNSSEFPPKDIISKALGLGDNYIGKFKHSDNHYDVYYMLSDGRIKSYTFIRLDTGIWISPGKYIIVQK